MKMNESEGRERERERGTHVLLSLTLSLSPSCLSLLFSFNALRDASHVLGPLTHSRSLFLARERKTEEESGEECGREKDRPHGCVRL
jgi:hypothetical protein